MLHDGWFWAFTVLVLILTVAGFVVWAIVWYAPRHPPTPQPEPEKSFVATASIRPNPEDGTVQISYERRVMNVSLDPASARVMANAMTNAAEVAERGEKAVMQEHERFPTSWDRIKDD